MSEFAVNVVKVDSVEKHPDADRLTIVKIGGYSCISNLDDNGNPRYKTGDLVVYIPESAIVPDWILQKHGFWKDGKGMLAGSKGNRVKAIKLRGIVSQGILYPITQDENQENVLTVADERYDGEEYSYDVSLEQDVAALLGITKYEPPIPTHMQGEVAARSEYAFKYDIESLQKEIKQIWVWIPDEEWDGIGEIDPLRPPPENISQIVG